MAVMIFMPLLTTLPLFLIGMSAQALRGSEKFVGDQAMGFILEQVSQTWFGSIFAILVLAGAVSAMMSTADSALLTISSISNRDLLERYVAPGRPSSFYLGIGKLTSWVVVLALAALATWMVAQQTKIWQILSIKLELLMQIAPAIWIGVRTRRLSGQVAFVAMLTGSLLTLAGWLFAFKKVLGVQIGIWALALNLLICLVALGLSSRQKPR